MAQFTLAKALAIQQRQLDELQTILNDRTFAQLLRYVIIENRKLTGNSSPYDVCRGTDLNRFVQNQAIKNYTKLQQLDTL